MKSGLTLPMLVNFINRKYSLSVPFAGFNLAVSSVRREIHSCIDFTQTQTLQLLQMLEKIKAEGVQIKFSYLFDTAIRQKDQFDPNNPQIEILFI
jgi:hypothetical protein